MKLSSIIQDNSFNYADTEINKICIYPQDAGFGSLFVSLNGSADLERAAIRNGASAIVTTSPSTSYGVPTFFKENIRSFYSFACCKLSEFEKSKVKLIGVVGTNGKTSVATIIYKSLIELGQKAGLIGTGTIECSGEQLSDSYYSMTTPDPHILYPVLKKMEDMGARYVVMEVSSHALFYEKVAPLCFEIAVFTNLSPEHLDFHRDIEEYYRAKSKIQYLTKKMIINNDDAYGRRLYDEAICQKLSLGVVFNESDVKIAHIKSHGLSGTEYLYKSNKFCTLLKTPLPCAYNVYNTALAFGVLTELKFMPCEVKNAISRVNKIDGRFEIVSDRPTVIIDYAHTPEAFESFLREAKKLCGKLCVVFGCGGNRDKSKRPKMAQIAEKFAELSIITNDNPRSENEEAIIEDIISGFPRACQEGEENCSL